MRNHLARLSVIKSRIGPALRFAFGGMRRADVERIILDLATTEQFLDNHRFWALMVEHCNRVREQAREHDDVHKFEREFEQLRKQA